MSGNEDADEIDSDAIRAGSTGMGSLRRIGGGARGVDERKKSEQADGRRLKAPLEGRAARSKGKRTQVGMRVTVEFHAALLRLAEMLNSATVKWKLLIRM